jgi:hypothetical protein
VQDLYCEDDGDGSLRITFREASTVTLRATDPLAKLKTALEGVPTINNVDIVNLNVTDAICHPAGHVSRIRFLSTHGDLPLMQVRRSPHVGLRPARCVVELSPSTCNSER